MSSPLTECELFEFDLNGYTILRNFLPIGTVERMNEIVETSESRSVNGKFPYLHLNPMFFDLMANPRALEICEFLLGEWFRLDYCFGLQYGLAGDGNGRGTEGLHAGPYANQGVFRYSWFNGRPRPGLVVFDYFLKEVHEGDGGLVLVPGSHKLNLGMTGYDVYERLLRKTLKAPWIANPAMQPGDLLIFAEAVIHGTARWAPTERFRRNLHMSYSPGYQASRNVAELDKYLPLAKTEQQRLLLRPPYVVSFEDDGPVLGKNTWRSKTRI